MLTIAFIPIQQFSLGPLTIHLWGLMVAIGIIAGLFIIRYLTNQPKADKSINFDHILNITLISIIFGFIGARLLYIFLEPDRFDQIGDIFRIWDGGLALYGGLFLAIIFNIIYVKKNKLDTLKTADLVVPGLVAAMAISRVGCFLINDHLGKITSLPWAVQFIGIPRHPVSAYYVISLLVLFIILLLLKSKLEKPGLTTYFALSWYSFFRFIIDFTRDFGGRDDVFIINQIFLGAVFIIAVFFLINSYKKAKTS